MAEDERLREALLELQMLRDREAQVLNETKTLLDCLEAYTNARSPGDALASIFVSLKQKIGSTLSFIATQTASGPFVVASDEPDFVGAQFSAPIDLFTRSRNISDVALLGEWTGPINTNVHGGAIIALIDDKTVFISLRERPERFRRQDIDLVQRLSGLASQAVENSEIATQKDLLAATISGSSSGFAISDATSDKNPLIYVNKAFEELSGYSSAEVIGENCRFLSAEDRNAPERARLREAVARRTGGTFLLQNRRKNGELFWNELTLYPVRGPSGQVRNLVATQTDVTARLAAAKERDVVRSRMESALTATEDAFLVLEADGQIAFANDAVGQFFPAPGIDWKSQSTFAENWAAYLAESEDMPGRITSLLRKPDTASLADLPSGREIDLPDGRSVLLRAGRLDDGGLVISATDITASKSAQRLLSQRLAAIEAAQDGIVVTDEDGRIIYRNSSAAALLGFLGPAAGLGRRWQRQYVSLAPFDTNKPFETTLDRDGLHPRQTHEITGSPLDGGGAVLVIRDVTESLADEEREADMMRELSRLQRQEAIAQLTAGIAHDFNNLLSAINGSATLIGLSDDLPENVRPHLDRISAAGNQSAKLISRLLDVGKGSDTQGAFDLSSVLVPLPQLLGSNLPETITFELAVDDGALALRGTSGTLSQILVNLVLNARDAIGDGGGQITVRASQWQGEVGVDAVCGATLPMERYVRLDVSDSGEGMSPEVVENAFKPFFTTKGRHGTGLGLATAALQVQSVDGAIAVESAVGEGTTISVFWPLAKVGSERDPRSEQGLIDLSGLTAIVVDDDPDVAEVISTYLSAQGMEVAVCADPRDALDAVAEDPAAWSAIITDYDMPIMNGGALAEAVGKNAPDLPIFVVTALAKRLSDPRLGSGKAAGIFSKPVDLEALSQALAEKTTKR